MPTHRGSSLAHAYDDFSKTSTKTLKTKLYWLIPTVPTARRQLSWPVKAGNDLDTKIELASQCEIVGYVLFLLANPPLLLHIQNYPGQGLSPVEVKTLHDILRIAGVNKVNIWSGPALSDDEVLGSDF